MSDDHTPEDIPSLPSLLGHGMSAGKTQKRPSILPGLDYEKAVTSLNDAKLLADVQSQLSAMPFSVDQLHKRAEIYALLATIGSLSGRDTELSENLSDVADSLRGIAMSISDYDKNHP